LPLHYRASVHFFSIPL